ncbi:MAG: EI24 domain-containing protein [Roseofilum sp. SBFL]|uniref:EI24 domain-containing protein n=1 Tax=unclassified Roseofilum TaxID=2620099 RepID=UPI001B209D40|nr:MULTISPECIES: EI24 domain-containing protein [unclassified Roseofilum]MBP0015004.1 EI24 domain-containing protein [Roseofilum sp. SID3]MBP0024556.1 EI24 domain-containing protein [Roseofilum sp. SID2]MBP0037288.1 EI24 domain-containing protein [Roseofilum sp. SID1]MBP0041391.1 EI24 domain-containing protein [Roseofilum sp. SBFL]
MFNLPMGLIAGATYPFRALALLVNQPKLRGYVIVPILINILIGIALYVGLVFPGLELVDTLTQQWTFQWNQWIASLPMWLGFLTGFAVVVHWLLNVLMLLVLFLVTGFLLVQFGAILGSPWYGQLSEQIEKIRLGQLPQINTHPLAIAQDIWRAILFELKKLLLMAIAGIPLLLFNFIPAIGTLVFSIGSLTLATTLVCLDFFDSPLERRKLPFRQKLTLVWRTFPASATFGLVCFGLVSVPFINILTVPLCVSGGTLLFCDRIWPHYFTQERSDIAIGTRE